MLRLTVKIAVSISLGYYYWLWAVSRTLLPRTAAAADRARRPQMDPSLPPDTLFSIPLRGLIERLTGTPTTTRDWNINTFWCARAPAGRGRSSGLVLARADRAARARVLSTLYTLPLILSSLVRRRALGR